MPKPRVRDSKIQHSLTKFRLTLNDEQTDAINNIAQSDVTLLIGKAGSGKTLTACCAALQLLQTKQIQKIYITRPTVTDQSLAMGFLPGDLKEKMDPWVAPLYANLDSLVGKAERIALIEKDLVELAPLAYMRGRTFLDACIIVDEVQNVTSPQLEMTLTRLGLGSKMILCGDLRQVDLKKSADSGLPLLVKASTQIKGLMCIELKTNHRHPIVDEILDFYQKSPEKRDKNIPT
jgi:phosphate starvation-inducible PhoH-like protein